MRNSGKSRQDVRRVALVRGPILSTTRSINNEATPSIAYAYLGGYLRSKGYEVSLIDGVAEALGEVWVPEAYPGYHCQGLTLDEVISRIPADSDVICFSAMFSGEWPIVRDLIVAVRAAFPAALLVAGGEHMTALTEYSLRDCAALDVCVRGEGEHTLYELVEARREGEDFSTLDGIGYLDADGTYRQGEGLPRMRDVGSLPWPYWPEGYLEKFWAAGKSYGVQTARDMPMILSRGCPYQCTFCSSPQMWTTRYILRDIDDIIAEIRHYIARYDITAVQLYDLTAITKKRWAVDFIKKIVAAEISINWSFPSGTRSEALDDETLGLLKALGCNYLVYAPESGSPATLEQIKKRVSLDKITASIGIAKSHQLVVRTNLIIGFPHERRRDMFQTIRYGLKLAIKGADEVSINIFSPYPGTEIFDELLSAKRVTVNDDYFLALTSLNSDYTAGNPMTINDHVGSRELAFYRITFMLLNYGLGYLFYPRRIIRTLRNIMFDGSAETVFEHRLKDLFRRNRRSIET